MLKQPGITKFVKERLRACNVADVDQRNVEFQVVPVEDAAVVEGPAGL